MLSVALDCAGATQKLAIRLDDGRSAATIADAARMVHAGGSIQIPAGDYPNGAATWEKDDVTVRVTGGRARVTAPVGVEGKATWLVRARNLKVENVDFVDAPATAGDGEGIRLEGGSLSLDNCSFVGNQVGLMTSNNPEIELTITRSEFYANRATQRLSHQLYAGRIGVLRISDSYFHGGFNGHLIKSRARANYISYNRISDEQEGSGSYKIEFPDGGFAVVLANIIEQGAKSENTVMVSFGTEALFWPLNELYISHNTFVNDSESWARFIRVNARSDLVKAFNNVFVGPGTYDLGPHGDQAGNARATARDFANLNELDVRPRRRSSLAHRAAPIPDTYRQALLPMHEYVHPRTSRPLTAPGRMSVGAMQSTAP